MGSKKPLPVSHVEDGVTDGEVAVDDGKAVHNLLGGHEDSRLARSNSDKGRKGQKNGGALREGKGETGILVSGGTRLLRP